MAEKKNEVITFRTETWVKDELNKVANHNKWSTAQVVNQLCLNYLSNPQPNQITIKADDLIKAAIAIRQEGLEKGVEISIDLIWDEENNVYKKELNFAMIECGGLGQIGGFNSIAEMSFDEISNIP